ncbi:P-loop containing nucleoside triphosphate hydrolase [Pseudocohnilembus persalinus]|uniref:p-loop containing nucleoside triphosphate hydrolase n=1 Tax=Pseudocohnilembus persalinus TaxID=266149 RepID=A0A0V0QM08_PSEPJ|nr:P-loop containing nucleoside triphosphate hydrolase [Pseudocohnilembus persalinus]|eukprot:KRX03252.1 P-loop containing nucleoside triphosphate hydrolase [Pseudocohnilembus persalinus]
MDSQHGASLLNQTIEDKSQYLQTEQTDEISFQCVMIGNPSVGKSSFLVRFAYDTAGQENFRALSYSYFKKADGVLLFYDISDEKSFKDLDFWVEQVQENAKAGDVPTILIGHKSDLTQKRKVTFNEGKQYAQKNGFSFIEASAKLNDNIILAFAKLTQKMLIKKFEWQYSQLSIKTLGLSRNAGGEDQYEQEDDIQSSIIKLQNNGNFNASRRGMLISDQNDNNIYRNQQKNVQCTCCN